MGTRLEAPCLGVTLNDGDRSFRLVADGLRIAAGEVVAVTGESGTGKTLFLEVLGLLRRPDAGASCLLRLPGPAAAIDLFAGWNLPGQASLMARLRREVFGFVPQSGGLLPYLGLGANIALTQQLSGRRDPAYCARITAALGLAGREGQMPDALSIGERQRVAIARALAHRPPVVIADEPTAALDPGLSREVMTLFLDLAAAQGTTVILSTHDLGLTRDLGLRRLVCTIDGGDGRHVVSRLIQPPADQPARPLPGGAVT